ncbi:hypothetical protein [Streptomyces sp. NPDC048521]|uniref:hypothetical protein n=1 Tax=Streptomyces sp. NPDC048521 TaxID=3365566 RepID=UPI003723722B
MPSRRPCSGSGRATRRTDRATTEIVRHGEELRDAPDGAEALYALFEERIRVVDERVAELAALRSDLTSRMGTGCPLRAADPAG